MICSSCGTSNAPQNRFCGMCGQPLNRQHAPASATAELRDPTDPARVIRLDRHPAPIQDSPAASPDSEPAYPTHESEVGTELRSQRVEPVEITGPAAAVTDETIGPEPIRDRSLHGPSFLGLADEPELGPANDYSYLYEDEPAQRSVPWTLLGLVAAIVLAAFLGFMYYKLREGERAALPQRAKPATPAAPSDEVITQYKRGGVDMEVVKPATQAAGPEGAKPTSRTNNRTATGSPEGPAEPSAAAISPPDASQNAAAAEAREPKADSTPETEQQAKDESSPDASEAKTAASRAADENAVVRRADALIRTRNCAGGVALLREAALQGNAKARSRLGGLYATGHCVSLDRAEAYNWFTLARDAGERAPWIEHNRAMLWAAMDDAERGRVHR